MTDTPDLVKLADAIDPRRDNCVAIPVKDKYGNATGWLRLTESDLIAASDALRTHAAALQAQRKMVIDAIQEQIDNQRNIVKSIKDRHEKEIEAARIVGMGDAILAIKSALGL